jgi:catechol 2,3-dioxygenase-like lactoylglutathione lyase family enzyme
MWRLTALGLVAILGGLFGQSLKYAGVLLAVDDVARSKAFYQGLLGRKIKFDFGRDVTFEGDFTIHQRSHFQEILGGADRYPVTSKANSGELYFEAALPEFYAQRLASAGVEFIHPLREQPWGQRVLRVYDPDGHIVEIGEPMETAVRRLHDGGMTAEAIMKKTHLPKAFVDGALSSR